MSQRLLALNPDLRKLREAGYDVSVESGYLVVRNLPYVAAGSVVKRGILASELSLAGDKTVRPGTHVVYFSGDYPCYKTGAEIDMLRHSTATINLTANLQVHYQFSNKPAGGYADYYEKMATYIAIISNEAAALDPKATPRTFPVYEPDETESVFCYIDTASVRAEITSASRKLEGGRVAIVGLGGTGSYVLDLLAKTPVAEIHLYDGDDLLTHNAFRAPGAVPLEQLRQRVLKVDYFTQVYSAMRRNIVPHGVFIDKDNVADLSQMDFIFLCMDKGDVKRFIIERLEQFAKPFIDVGMGLYLVNDSLGGIVRVVASTPEQRSHVWEKGRIPFATNDDANIYSKNIQVADLNALNATLAVIKWKKLRGFYSDLAGEHYSAYTVDGNRLSNDDAFRS